MKVANHVDARYGNVVFKRRLPPRGPPSLVYWIGGASVIAWGMYKVGMGNLRRRAIHEEKLEARKAIVPLLQAEEDVYYLCEEQRLAKVEADIMKDTKGWEVNKPVYLKEHKQFVPPIRSSSLRST